MAVTFYTNPMSRGQIARWALHEAGVGYDEVIVGYDAMKSPDYLAVNPMGKVPAIAHDGVVVTEAAAISAFTSPKPFPRPGSRRGRWPKRRTVCAGRSSAPGPWSRPSPRAP